MSCRRSIIRCSWSCVDGAESWIWVAGWSFFSSVSSDMFSTSISDFSTSGEGSSFCTSELSLFFISCCVVFSCLSLLSRVDGSAEAPDESPTIIVPSTVSVLDEAGISVVARPFWSIFFGNFSSKAEDDCMGTPLCCSSSLIFAFSGEEALLVWDEIEPKTSWTTSTAFCCFCASSWDSWSFCRLLSLLWSVFLLDWIPELVLWTRAMSSSNFRESCPGTCAESLSCWDADKSSNIRFRDVWTDFLFCADLFRCSAVPRGR